MPVWLEAGLWGLFAGSALMIGAAVGFYRDLKKWQIAAVMAFGSGVLISALSIELLDEAFTLGGFDSTAVGFISGAVIYTVAELWPNLKGAWRRMHHGMGRLRQPTETEMEGSGRAMTIASVIDGIPESIAIGVTLVLGGAVSVVTVAAIFISNVPEGLAATSGNKAAGRPASAVFAKWTAIMAISGLAALAGASVFSNLSPGITATGLAVAAGAMLTMLAGNMIPVAYEDVLGSDRGSEWQSQTFIGMITAAGFLLSYIISQLG